MRLLVTGGAGFIGSNFIHYWFSKHPTDCIINLDKLTYAGNLENLQGLKHQENYRFVKGDICDAKLVGELLQGIDIVCHFAAETHVDRSILHPSAFVETNVVGTHILLEAALRNKVKRFHHISTDEVYGSLQLTDAQKFSEVTRYDPKSPYAASKAASDHLVRSYEATYGIPVTITNCSNNFGPYQFPEKLIPLAITNVLEGKKVPVYGDGLYIRDWLYVRDHCRAIELVLLKGRKGQTYCVGGLMEDVTNLDVIRKILRILGKDDSWIEFVPDRPGHDRKYALDWSKIKNELGWHPQHDFDTLLAKTVEWYTVNLKWWKKIKESKEYQEYYTKHYLKK